MKKYKVPATIMLIQGIVAIIGSIILITLSASDTLDWYAPITIGEAIMYLESMPMLILEMILGVVSIIGALALLKNKCWGLALTASNCVFLMVSVGAIGIVNALFVIPAFILLLIAYFGNKELN